MSGCATLGWYGQAVRGQLEILSGREDIADLIADPETPDELRDQLGLALEIREFASRELGLPDNRSYTVYVDLEREAVVWNVVAAPRFELTPKRWCYLFVGCLAYRGYFRRPPAEELASQLAARGYDTLVAPVPAYSTLGRFTDPVLNTMLDFSPTRLAGLIFHELAHQQIFVRGDTRFNEAYATFIEREGVRRWLRHRGDRAAQAAWEQHRALQAAFTELLLEARGRLEALYATGLPEAEMARAKSAEFDRLKDTYQHFREFRNNGRYDRYMDQELNNAHLALVATYESGTNAFAALLAEYDGDLIRFHQAVARLARSDATTRQQFLEQKDQ